MMKNNRVTLAVLATKLDAQTEAINELIKEFKKHVDEGHELELSVDRLMQADKNRIWHIRAVWTSLLAGGIAWLFRALL